MEDSKARFGTISYEAFKQVVLTRDRLPKLILTPDDFVQEGEVYYTAVPGSREIRVLLNTDDYIHFKSLVAAIGVEVADETVASRTH